MKKPENIKVIDFNYVVAYCSEQGEAEINWLENLMNKEVAPDKNGNPRRMSFIEVRNAFVDKYMPEIKPVPKAKKPTMAEKIMAAKNK